EDSNHRTMRTVAMSSDSPMIPGKPTAQSPDVDEPETPQTPPEPKPDQRGPQPTTPTGALSNDDGSGWGQQGEYHTTARGGRLPDTNHSIKAGSRGTVLLQDHHLREKNTQFYNERLPVIDVHDA